MNANGVGVAAAGMKRPVEVAPAEQGRSGGRAFDVQRVAFDAPVRDVMGGAARLEIKVHEHGFIALVDCMPRLVGEGQTGDAAIVQAARVSYGQGTKKVSEDRGLIRYLMRHRHTTPFEMLEFKFHVAMPIFVARQWIRHRTANVNEYSARYSIVPDRFYRPGIEDVRKQSAANKQGGAERFRTREGIEASRHQGIKQEGIEAAGQPGIEQEAETAALLEHATAEEFLAYLEEAEGLYRKYERLTGAGVSRELARIGLPVSAYTQWYWKCDLHNILRFLSLRMDAHAQEEIRVYAEAMHALLEPIVPLTMEAFRDYELESMRLTRLEIEALRAGRATIASENKREVGEWEEKRRAMGLG